MTTHATSTAVPAIRGRPARDRLHVLDGLRLIAALMVVAYHYTYRAPGQWGGRTADVFADVAPATAYGWLGVQLFFLISGFVICMSAWGRNLRRFAASRTARLFPAYWFGVFATVSVVAFLDSDYTPPSTGHLIANLTMLQTPMGVPSIDGVYWTLWAEMRFYLLFALVVWRGLTYRRVVTFCLAWTVASTVAALSGNWRLTELLDADCSPFFVAGIAMHLIYRFKPTVTLAAIIAVSCGLGLWRLAPTVAFVGTLGPHGHWWPGVTAVVIGIFAVMTMVALRRLSWVRGAWLTTAGTLTYPLYLIHQEIGYAVIARLHGVVPRWPLVLGVVLGMLGAAWVTHQLVERPLGPLTQRGVTSALRRVGDAVLAMRRRTRRPADLARRYPRS